MVRFSDMLGGDGEPDATAQTAARDLPPLVDDAPPDADAAPDDAPPEGAAPLTAEAEVAPADADPSPQDVLDRLTQYATATRAAAPIPEPQPEPEPAPAPRTPADDTGDDLLPRAKRSLRNPRGKRDR
jgi:hypothetical protein